MSPVMARCHYQGGVAPGLQGSHVRRRVAGDPMSDVWGLMSDDHREDGAGGGGLNSEVQCIMGKGRMGTSLWTDTHTAVKTLPSRNFVGGQLISNRCLFWEQWSKLDVFLNIPLYFLQKWILCTSVFCFTDQIYIRCFKRVISGQIRSDKVAIIRSLCDTGSVMISQPTWQLVLSFDS